MECNGNKHTNNYICKYINIFHQKICAHHIYICIKYVCDKQFCCYYNKYLKLSTMKRNTQLQIIL